MDAERKVRELETRLEDALARLAQLEEKVARRDRCCQCLARRNDAIVAAVRALRERGQS